VKCCTEDSLDNTLFVLYIYDDGIIDICYVLVWNLCHVLGESNRCKSKLKKKKKRFIEAVFKPPQ
jgi:hypothetical protein